MEPINIVHVTTVHPRGDTRIRVREVGALAHDLAEPVALLVQDGQGDSIEEDGRIRIIDIGARPRGRLARMMFGALRAWRAVRALRPRLVHFHDPELIPLGLLLRCAGYRVIYDAHEDLPRQALTKYWLPAMTRRPVSWAMSAVEWLAVRGLNAVVTAEPKIAERFPARKTTLAHNFPILNELVSPDVMPYSDRPPHFAYIGGITRLRGIMEMIDALHRSPTEDIRLCLAGVFQPAGLRTDMEARPGWQRVDYAGWAGRAQVREILSKVRGGLVILHPTQKYRDAYPTKMFEYMAASLPVIVSDFPLWRRIVEQAGCGLLVDPQAPQAVAEAMQWILDHPAEAETMGQCGRAAVEQHYNWAPEAQKLLALYKQLLSG